VSERVHYICGRSHWVESDAPLVYPAWNRLPGCPHRGCRDVLRRVPDCFVSFFRLHGMDAARPRVEAA
jgi:hypothetical protein